MAKKQSNTSVTGNGGRLVHNEFIDDGILPDSHELKRYNEIGPDVVRFIMERTSIEQEYRHKFSLSNFEEKKHNNRRSYNVTMSGLFCGATIILVTLLVSAFLIMNGFPIIGSVFAGTSIFSSIFMFVNKGKGHTS